MLRIRRATTDDAAEVADLYLASFRAALPTVRLAHDDDDVRRFIREVAIGERDAWVAEETTSATDAAGPRIVGMLVLAPGWIEQLYVVPDRLGEGIGRALLALAIERADGPLELWTFQVNARARRFYERNGFQAVELTDGSRNEERAPDVRYRREPTPTPAPGRTAPPQAK